MALNVANCGITVEACHAVEVFSKAFIHHRTSEAVNTYQSSQVSTAQCVKPVRESFAATTLSNEVLVAGETSAIPNAISSFLQYAGILQNMAKQTVPSSSITTTHPYSLFRLSSESAHTFTKMQILYTISLEAADFPTACHNKDQLDKSDIISLMITAHSCFSPMLPDVTDKEKPHDHKNLHPT